MAAPRNADVIGRVVALYAGVKSSTDIAGDGDLALHEQPVGLLLDPGHAYATAFERW